MHTGGNVSGRVNLGEAASAASGNTVTLTNALTLGARAAASIFFDGKIFEAAVWSTPPSSGGRDAIEQAFLSWVS